MAAFFGRARIKRRFCLNRRFPAFCFSAKRKAPLSASCFSAKQKRGFPLSAFSFLLFLQSKKRRFQPPAFPQSKKRGFLPSVFFAKQKALLFGSAFCIEGWESIKKFDVINLSVFIIHLLLHLSKGIGTKKFKKKVYNPLFLVYN